MAIEDQTPKLSPDWDAACTRMTPSEGFLLSRIDGITPWGQLLQIGGLPPAEVDRCLKRWLAEGVLTVESPGAATRRVDRGSDITRDEQQRIEQFEGRLERPYHEILGVEPDADTRMIKRAYFALSKEFHPDRHFRRSLGSYHGRLERIFRKIVEAYELLSDPTTRSEIAQSLGAVPAATVPVTANGAQASPDSTRQPAAPQLSPKRAALERMRRHFRIPEKVLLERKFKAKQFSQAARISSRRESWLEAAASIRLAIAFDPWNDEYKREFAAVQAQAHQLRAQDLLREADASLDGRAQHQALQMYEEALSYRPCDPEINAKAARLALELGEHDAAREYAESACEFDPEVAETHAILGKVLSRMGLRDRAIAALERAKALDPDDRDVNAQLASMNRNRRGKKA